eukprot:2544890-Rhodomonas_salina.1
MISEPAGNGSGIIRRYLATIVVLVVRRPYASSVRHKSILIPLRLTPTKISQWYARHVRLNCSSSSL